LKIKSFLNFVGEKRYPTHSGDEPKKYELKLKKEE